MTGDFVLRIKPTALWILSSLGAGAAMAPHVVLAQGGPLRALAGRQTPYSLVYDHLRPGFEFVDPTGKVIARSEERRELHLTLPASRPVVVEIRNANALLYKYDVQPEIVQERDLHACGRSAGRFVQQGFFIGVSAFQGKEPPAPIAPESFEERVKVLAAQRTRARGADRLTPTEAGDLLQAGRDPLAEYVSFANQVAALAAEVEDSLASVAELAEWRPADSLLTRVQRYLQERHPTFGSPSRVAEIIADRQQALRPAYGALVRVARAIETGAYTGSREDSVARAVFSQRKTVEAAYARLDSAYRRLHYNLDLLETARALATQQLVIPASDHVRRVTIIAAPTAHFPSVMRLRQARVAATLTGRRSISCRISIGFAMLDRIPDYRVEDSRLVDVSNGRQQFTPTLLLHVGRSARAAALLLGIGPGHESAPNVYAGASWSLFGDFFVNAGAVWQRTPRLPPQYQVGQAVDPADFPGPEHRFKATVFVGASLTQ